MRGNENDYSNTAAAGMSSEPMATQAQRAAAEIFARAQRRQKIKRAIGAVARWCWYTAWTLAMMACLLGGMKEIMNEGIIIRVHVAPSSPNHSGENNGTKI